MSETFVKLFGSITDSSLWDEDSDTRIVWITMLAMADQHGYVGASVGGVAARARLPASKTREAIEKFLGPDPESRSPENEGRRIEVADRGWTVLNYQKFRNLRDDEVRRAYFRAAKRDQREREVSKTKVGQVETSQNVQLRPTMSTQAEAEAEAEADMNCSEPAQTPASEQVVLAYPVVGKGGPAWNLGQLAIDRWVSLFPGVDVLAECRSALAWVEANRERRKTAGGMTRFLVAWLGRAQNRGPSGGGSSRHAATPASDAMAAIVATGMRSRGQ
jgi:hypothetical protein